MPSNASKEPTPAELLKALNDSIQPLSETPIFANIHLYGESGSGKTVEVLKIAQAVTPPSKRILFLDSAQGFVSARNHPGLSDRVQRLQFKGVSQLETIAMALSAGVEGWDDFGSVIIDEVSSIQKEDMSTVVEARFKAGKNDQDERDIGGWPAYNANLERIGRAMRKLHKLEANLLLTSHQRAPENKETKIRVKKPSLPPELGEVINGLVHVVAHMSASVNEKNGKPVYTHTLQVHKSAMVTAKCRIGGLALKVTPNEFNRAVAEFVSGSRAEVEVESKIDVDDSFAGIEIEN